MWELNRPVFLVAIFDPNDFRDAKFLHREYNNNELKQISEIKNRERQGSIFIRKIFNKNFLHFRNLQAT